VEALERQAWDVQMDGIVSEQHWYRWRA